jgi:hypothetical protein
VQGDAIARAVRLVQDGRLRSSLGHNRSSEHPSAGLSRFAAAGNTVGLVRRTELRGDANKRSPRIEPEAGLIRYASGNWRTLTNTRRYGVFIVGPANAKLPALNAAAP